MFEKDETPVGQTRGLHLIMFLVKNGRGKLYDGSILSSELRIVILGFT